MVKSKHSILRLGAMVALLTLAPGVAAPQPTAGVDRETALARLDHAQQRLDDARARLQDSPRAGELAGTLDLAQRLLDRTREQLTGEFSPEEAAAFKDEILRTAAKLQKGVATTTKNVVGESSPETRAILATLGQPGGPSKEQLRAVFESAWQRLDRAKADLLAGPEVNPVLLRRLEDSERALEKARLDAKARGFLD